MMRVHEHDAAATARLEAVRQAPSLYDLTIRALHRRGFAIDESVLERDVSSAHLATDSVRGAWASVHREPMRFWELYELAEKLVDLEYRFHLWRFSHMKTVERIIGNKPGTGGTSGVNYLKKALDLTAWDGRTQT